MKKALAAIVVLMLALSLTAFAKDAPKADPKAQMCNTGKACTMVQKNKACSVKTCKYCCQKCGMVSEKPGKCPKCGKEMKKCEMKDMKGKKGKQCCEMKK